ncbi:hypothetical protein QR685DRAFT_572975 [Neurospora intermedia]|uniref:Uncharacterized protein n=1 Tax=Neurospora intermedia TaxID=5142 RepID=A0ABR3D9X0_NEUIN
MAILLGHFSEPTLHGLRSQAQPKRNLRWNPELHHPSCQPFQFSMSIFLRRSDPAVSSHFSGETMEIENLGFFPVRAPLNFELCCIWPVIPRGGQGASRRQLAQASDPVMPLPVSVQEGSPYMRNFVLMEERNVRIFSDL